VRGKHGGTLVLVSSGGVGLGTQRHLRALCINSTRGRGVVFEIRENNRFIYWIFDYPLSPCFL